MNLSLEEKKVSLIADLDLMCGESVGFKFNGKTHALNDKLSIEDLTEMELARIKLLFMLESRDQIAMPGEEIYERYFDFVRRMVPTLTYAEIRFMKPAQLNRLVNIIFRYLAGDTSIYEEKKNSVNQKKKMTGI